MSSPRNSATRGKAGAPTVVCFGEVLWDCLPKGLFLGGAPINAAYHLAKQGLRVLPVSAVGRDLLGNEVLRRVTGWGLDVSYIARSPNLPTGTVIAELDRKGVATYDIVRQVAWDQIPFSPKLRALSPVPSAVVFGTLALRTPANRRSLEQLLRTWPNALRVVDLNFRPPFNTEAAKNFALRNAQLVKLNDSELAELTRRKVRSADGLRRSAESLARQHQLARICVTAGARGAGLLWYGEWFWESGREIKVRDTVGSGDAFLGALLGALLNSASPATALSRACRLGEFVASQDGATPEYGLT
ncbi:MAG: PfkB family carbohydrate kinase, partial [Opitutus sp.]